MRVATLEGEIDVLEGRAANLQSELAAARSAGETGNAAAAKLQQESTAALRTSAVRVVTLEGEIEGQSIADRARLEAALRDVAELTEEKSRSQAALVAAKRVGAAKQREQVVTLAARIAELEGALEMSEAARAAAAAASSEAAAAVPDRSAEAAAAAATAAAEARAEAEREKATALAAALAGWQLRGTQKDATIASLTESIAALEEARSAAETVGVLLSFPFRANNPAHNLTRCSPSHH